MNTYDKPAKKNRSQRGSAIAELPGALFILLIMLFFPLVAMLSLGFAYGCCATLNNLQLREAVLVPMSQAKAANGSVCKGVVDGWKSSGLGQFVKLAADPTTQVTYQNGQMNQTTNIQDHLVTVTTTCRLNPFLPQTAKILPKLPALNEPVEFVYSSEAPLENPRNYSL